MASLEPAMDALRPRSARRPGQAGRLSGAVQSAGSRASGCRGFEIHPRPQLVQAPGVIPASRVDAATWSTHFQGRGRPGHRS